MKKGILLIALVITGYIANSQSIRKNYLEMTESEKSALVNAFFQLRNNGDLINDLALFHGNFFNFDNSIDPTLPDIHFNLPDEPERDIFFPWHRMQIFEVEQAMQELNPLLSMPYWNSTTDQSLNSPLWDENFLGQFNEAWTLARTPGAIGALPTPEALSTVEAISDFLTFSNEVERGPVHEGAHRWTGGIMSANISPRDPVFYLHHTFIDKVWHDWQELFNSSSYISTSMIRYDGNYTFNGQVIPAVNPNNIVDSRTLGVFYASDQQAILDEYTVSNTYNNQETFYYQYDIEVGSNFYVPTGKDASVISHNKIVLKPGFLAEDGSNFVARIETGESAMLAAAPNQTNSPAYNTKAFSAVRIIENAYNPENKTLAGFDFNTYPNPFNNQLQIQLDKKLEIIEVIITDLPGKVHYRGIFRNTAFINLTDLGIVSNGLYILQLSSGDYPIGSKKILKQ